MKFQFLDFEDHEFEDQTVMKYDQKVKDWQDHGDLCAF